MRKLQLCSILSVLSLAALQTWPAAAASPAPERQLSQEHWMLRQDGARTGPRSEVRVHFFNPNQIVRVSPRTAGAPMLRPAVAISRPVTAKLRDNAPRNAPRLMASHEAAGIGVRPQPEVRSGR